MPAKARSLVLLETAVGQTSHTAKPAEEKRLLSHVALAIPAEIPLNPYVIVRDASGRKARLLRELPPSSVDRVFARLNATSRGLPHIPAISGIPPAEQENALVIVDAQHPRSRAANDVHAGDDNPVLAISAFALMAVAGFDGGWADESGGTP